MKNAINFIKDYIETHLLLSLCFIMWMFMLIVDIVALCSGANIKMYVLILDILIISTFFLDMATYYKIYKKKKNS